MCLNILLVMTKCLIVTLKLIHWDYYAEHCPQFSVFFVQLVSRIQLVL